ncbi:hypothetical protein BJX63DRAFT_432299 [Aspergillus granulosus]|uniref:Zn(2)-C6 fungal-type domain-containing protein n=1 Tax=Aspergillus granulosus TaxID=176169 RepID=A0ABR4HC72_9EURO
MQPLAPKGGPVLKPVSGGIARRTKLTTACEKCRSLRKRCDGKKPCSSCRGLLVQCKYSGSDGRKKEEWKARVEALEQRNHYLERQIKHLKCNQAPGQETPEQELSSCESSSASAESRPTFSSAVQPHKVDYVIEHMFYAATANHPLLGSLNTLYGHSDSNMRSQLPDEHITRYALDAFFQCAATLFYVTTEENAAQLLRKVYHTTNASIQDVCELSALCAIGSHYTIDKVTDAARARYFFLATTNLNEAIQVYHIQGLRIFICLCMSCIMDKSLSARLLVMSGLNLARARTEVETERSNPNRNDMIEYRRTLQTMVFFEGWLSYSLGYRNSLKESELELVRENIPHREDFMDFKAFTTCLIQYYMTKLALIASEIQNEIVLCQQDYWNHADPLSKKLDLWYQELPLELHLAALSKLEEEKTVTILQKRGAYMMHMLYIDSRLQLCCQLLNAAQAFQSDSDPLFLESLFNQAPGHFWDTNTGFAIQLSKILSLMFTNQAIMTRCWLVMRSAFDTCIVLFLGLCHKYFTTSENWNLSEIFSHVDSCFQVLRFCASHDVAAKSLRDLVDPVHEHLSHMSLRPRPMFEPASDLQQRSEKDMNKMTIRYMLDSKASDALTLVRMTHHLLKFMPPHKWDIWI